MRLSVFTLMILPVLIVGLGIAAYLIQDTGRIL
jgi:hypothetical protein